jgi:ABC-type lipoprotein release transport system permease subunit
MNVFKMGWRNVWRNKRRSGIAISAMTLALWVLLLYAGIIPGYIKSMEHSVTQLEIGDVQIHANTYLKRPSLYTTIEDERAILEQLDEAGLAATPRLIGGGLAAHEESSSGVSLRGLDITREDKVSSLGEAIDHGNWLDPRDTHGVVLGRRLAKNLGVEVGGELVVVSQATDGSVANDLFLVRGILQSVGEMTDRSAVLMNADVFRELMVLPTGAHQIVVRRGEATLDDATRQVQAMAPDLDVQSWKQRMPLVAQMIDMGRVGVYIMSFIIYLSVGLLILNAMLTAVFERIREFGVLKAIGAGPMKVMSLILVEGLVQAAVASVLGLILAIPAMWYLTKYGINMGALGGMDAGGVAIAEIWYAEFSLQTCALPITILWVMTLIAVLYPAIKAAWIHPIHAMRHR